LNPDPAIPVNQDGYGYGSRFLSGSRVLMTLNKKNTAKNLFIFFSSKSLGLHKGRLSYRRSLQPSKENIQHFKT